MKRQHRLFYGSSYDRGLHYLLDMWPKIKKIYPEAELHVCYGWDFYDKAYADNMERMAWKARMNHDMQREGITHHGRLGKEELKEVRSQCGIWSYPTDFGETCCITALDCQREGVVPVVMAKAGLKETVQSGIKVAGEIEDEETQQSYLDQLLGLMDSDGQWESESKKGQEFAQQFGWNTIAFQWLHLFGEREEVSPHVQELPDVRGRVETAGQK